MTPSLPAVTSGAAGLDVASVDRIATVLARRPALAQRCFTSGERRDSEGHPERWAARWAVKEAVRKLAGSLGVVPLPAFADIELVRGTGGAPSVRLHGHPADLVVSVTHDAGLAAAVVLALPAPRVPATSPDAPPAMAPAAGLVLPARPRDGHKGTYGIVCVVAGAVGFTGAAYLAAMGAARGGAGRIRLGVPAALHPAMAVKCVEVMAHALPDGGSGVLTSAALPRLRDELLEGAGVLVVGPGLGRAPQTRDALLELLSSVSCPVVVDADGLTLAAECDLDWHALAAPVVLTPHPAEMGRLAGVPTSEVQEDRRGTALRYAVERGVVLVLKGANTLIVSPDGRVAEDPHVTPALATAGTGDVLAGLIGALVAGGAEPWEAARAGVAIHGEAGCALEAERGRAGVLASDLLEALPAAQERLRRALEERR